MNVLTNVSMPTLHNQPIAPAIETINSTNVLRMYLLVCKIPLLRDRKSILDDWNELENDEEIDVDDDGGDYDGNRDQEYDDGEDDEEDHNNEHKYSHSVASSSSSLHQNERHRQQREGKVVGEELSPHGYKSSNKITVASLASSNRVEGSTTGHFTTSEDACLQSSFPTIAHSFSSHGSSNSPNSNSPIDSRPQLQTISSEGHDVKQAHGREPAHLDEVGPESKGLVRRGSMPSIAKLHGTRHLL